jgi:ABC-type phosphate/phosphonate transport system substrate-binding protein
VLLGIRPTTAAQRQFLTLFGAKRFVPTQPSNYAQIEEVAVRETVVVDYAAMSRR